MTSTTKPKTKHNLSKLTPFLILALLILLAWVMISVGERKEISKIKRTRNRHARCTKC